MALLDLFLSRFVTRGRLSIAYTDGRVAQLGDGDPAWPDVAIRFTDRATPGRIVRNPDLATAEAFMDGRLVIERGDIMGLIELLKRNDRATGARNLKPRRLRAAAQGMLRRIDRINDARRSRRNVAHHYDLSRRLYALFLDGDLQYSCAYFADADNGLDQAQVDKTAHIAAKLRLASGHHVLDIGCGWGGTALYLNGHYGCRVTGITLSQEQLAVARERAEAAGVADRVTFELIDYRAVEGRFDRIVSIGMFEHVGVPQYAAFFRKVASLLTPDGVALVHTIGRRGRPGRTDAFTAKYIFPGGYNPALSEIARGYEGSGLFLADAEVLRMHYGHTLRHWYDRTVANRDAIVALYDERFYRMWTFYLAGAWAAFAHGGMVNYQLQFTRDRHALPITRDYMLEEEQRLRAAI